MRAALNANCIKIIAIAAMTIDHIAWLIFYVAMYSIVYFFALDKVYGLIQMGVILAIPVLMMYNGQRGNNQKFNHVIKWLFYIYYPLHLWVIGWIQLFIRNR